MFKNSLMISSATTAINVSAFDNTLTRLFTDLYAGLDVVSRELVGFIPSVARTSTAERLAVGQTLVSHVSKPKTAINLVPAMVPPEPRDTDRATKTMTITKQKIVEFGYTGDENLMLNSGPGALSVQADEFAQALREIVNQVEVDTGLAAMSGFSRAFGVSGTTPFATDASATAQLKKILDDNGAPASDRSLVINTTSGAALRSIPNLTRVNEAGSAMTLRQGELLDLNGFSIKESGGAPSKVAGTSAGATTNATGYAIGATVITLAAAGTGTVTAGDAIIFAGDTNQYGIAVGDVDVSNGGTITLAEPGLRRAIPAVATAITMTASFAGNLAFSRNAIQLATRLPALPPGGDGAADRYILTDARSGLSFDVAMYKGFYKNMMTVGLAWGTGVFKPEHIALLKG